MKTKSNYPKPSSPWFNSALSKLKIPIYHLENIWQHSHSAEDIKFLCIATNCNQAAIVMVK
jgi:hypothetical protein